MSGGEYMRSGSPDPLPVPPRHQKKNGYREDRMRYPEPERHRSQRRRDYDRNRGNVHGGEVRVRDAACEYHSPCFDMTHLPRAFYQHRLSSHTFHQLSRVNMGHVLSLGTRTRLNIPISSSQSVQDAERRSV